MSTAAVSGIQISYADSAGDGPAAVLSHWFLMDQSMFDAGPARPPRRRAGCPRRHVPGRLPQPAGLTWPFRCLMDRDDITGRLAEIVEFLSGLAGSGS
jgi:hypothetical protein